MSNRRVPFINWYITKGDVLCGDLKRGVGYEFIQTKISKYNGEKQWALLSISGVNEEGEVIYDDIVVELFDEKIDRYFQKKLPEFRKYLSSIDVKRKPPSSSNE